MHPQRAGRGCTGLKPVPSLSRRPLHHTLNPDPQKRRCLVEILCEAGKTEVLPSFVSIVWVTGFRLTGMASSPPDYETRHARFPLSNFPPQAGERANEKGDFHVNPHLNPLTEGEEAIALSPSGGKLDRGLAGIIPDCSIEPGILVGAQFIAR